MLSGVLTLGRRASVVMLTLALVAGNFALCAAWTSTPEARMTCCAEGSNCPMHKSDSSDSHSKHLISQTQADRCCALSERSSTEQSTPTFAVTISPAVLGVAVALPAQPPALVLSQVQRSLTPLRASPVPKHVLLSVFLV
jgi:hypothetical protein